MHKKGLFLVVLWAISGGAWQHAIAASADAFVVPSDQIQVISATTDEAGAGAAIDGDTGTVWTVNGPYPQQLVFELPETYYITAIKYTHADKTNYLKDYSIYVSSDGQDWVNTAAPGTLKNTSLVWEVRLSWPHEAKFVRIDYLGSGGGSITTADISVISEGAVPPGKAESPTMPPVKEEPAPAPAPKPVSSGSSSSSSSVPMLCGAPPSLVKGNGSTFYVSPNGDDNVSCQQAQSLGTPMASLNAAAACLQPGDTLQLRGGTYNGNLHLDISGAPGNPITIENYPGETPVISPSGTGINDYGIVLGWNNTVGWINISGLEITGGSIGINLGDGNTGAHDVVISGNNIHDNTEYGVAGTGARVLLDSNAVDHNGVQCWGDQAHDTDNQCQGIYITGTDWTISNNSITGNKAYGIQVAGYIRSDNPEFQGASNFVIENNTIANQGYSGIVVWQTPAENNIIRNNVFRDNSQLHPDWRAQGISFYYSGSGHVVSDNVFQSSNGSTDIFDTADGASYTQTSNSNQTSGAASRAGASGNCSQTSHE